MSSWVGHDKEWFVVVFRPVIQHPAAQFLGMLTVTMQSFDGGHREVHVHLHRHVL
ncbi:hypothetical protein SGUI_1940 [Serinicoccus hydrothermalis]|uniref:Uncharacterized protein n=1 Tax=Serinicoccus hydrothermalis TaxID=1758689 RepID=A0A1B1ND37_9MICO|nr:hypothetical protein SGUI_1940 [Serinicoccus hydrothermalis]